MRKFFSLILVFLIIISLSGCISKETLSPSKSKTPTSTTQPTISESSTSTSPETTTTEAMMPTLNKEDLINAIESVEKYQFTAEYSTIPKRDTQINSKGGFDFTKEEAFWEITSLSGDLVAYSNEVVWGNSIYYSVTVEQDNKIVQQESTSMTIETYFKQVLQGRTEIKTVEEFKQWLFKGADPTRNSLYYIHDLLSNADSFEVSKEGSNYIVTFTFTKEEMVNLDSIEKHIKTEGTGKLWLEDNLPIKGEIKIKRTTSYTGLDSTTTTEAIVKFELSYRYERPEWVKKIVE